jgi:hypothetical protein
MKGSSVDRIILNQNELELIKSYKNFDCFKGYNNKVLKDEDFKNLKIKLNLKFEDCHNIINIVEEDTKFLKKHFITDYSLFLNIHIFNDNFDNILSESNRIYKSIDNKFIYCLSIIDFLTVLSTLI